MRDFAVYDWRERSLRELVPYDSEIGEAEVLSVYKSKTGSALFLHARFGSEDKVIHLEVGRENTKIKEEGTANGESPPFFDTPGLKRSADGRKAILWQKDAVGVLFFSPDEKGPARMDWMFKGGRDVAQVFWVHEASHVLFRDGRKIFLGEYAPGRQVAVRQLFASGRDGDVQYLEETGKVYFLDDQGALCSFEILPKMQILLP